MSVVKELWKRQEIAKGFDVYLYLQEAFRLSTYNGSRKLCM